MSALCRRTTRALSPPSFARIWHSIEPPNVNSTDTTLSTVVGRRGTPNAPCTQGSPIGRVK